MNTPTTPSVGLNKVKRTGLNKIYAVRVKPPDFQADETGGENHKFLFYYTTRNFKPKSQECTKHVWRRAEGRTGPGVVRDGFDSLSGNHDFILHEQPGEKDDDGKQAAGKIVAVDILPSTTYNAKTNAPRNVQEYKLIELAINTATGEIEFLEVPIGVSKQQLQQLITEIDKLSNINAGDRIGGRYYVYELQGNRLRIEPPAQGNMGAGRPGSVEF